MFISIQYETMSVCTVRAVKLHSSLEALHALRFSVMPQLQSTRVSTNIHHLLQATTTWRQNYFRTILIESSTH